MKGIILWLLFLALVWRPDQAQANYYQGKTVTIISGTTAGSAYDTYARVIAQHLGKHVPGSPSFIVQNMPGGGSIVAANFVYGVAKPDGLTIASINPALYFNQLAGRKEVQFDWAKFHWLGSPIGRITCFICEPTRPTRRFTTCAPPPLLPNAPPRQPAPRVIICRSF